MNIRAYSLLLLGCIAPLSACGGDDSSTPDKMTTPDPVKTGDGATPTAQPDAATGNTAKPDGGVAPSDAAVALDAATGKGDASTAPDSGKADTGKPDAGKPDAGNGNTGTPDAGNDSGTGTGTGSGLATSASCLACEKKYCARADINYGATPPVDLTALCDTLTGNATDGPKMGTAKSKLCHDYVDCANRTQCAKFGNVVDCICGAGVSLSDCMAKDPTTLTGACRNEFLAAAETTSWTKLTGQVANTAPETNYASADGNIFLQCQQNYCFEECYGSICKGMSDGASCGDQPAGATQTAARTCKAGICPPYDYFGMLLPDGSLPPLTP